MKTFSFLVLSVLLAFSSLTFASPSEPEDCPELDDAELYCDRPDLDDEEC